jgi:hypothetical protein
VTLATTLATLAQLRMFVMTVGDCVVGPALPAILLAEFATTASHHRPTWSHSIGSSYLLLLMVIHLPNNALHYISDIQSAHSVFILDQL